MAFPGSLPDWSNLEVLHRNTLPPRAHFYSYADEASALTFDRDQSLVHSLNGTWKFHYDQSPFEAPLWERADFSTWDDIEVPGMWQTQGYGHPHYTNIDFPFPVTPPNVSYINPTGSFWREFDVPSDWADQQVRLRYEGVDSAFHVWVNGKEVGYSQGSRNPSEFDITEYLVGDGETNTLATRVYQWSDGTYIEDQDQWWLSGIFRDVYLMPFDKSSAIVDYDTTPFLDDSFSNATLRTNVTVQGDHGPLDIQVLSPAGKKIKTWSGSSSSVSEISISGDELQLWSAETPNLYTVVLSFGGRAISQKVGFRRIERKGANFLVNGEAITIYGVNRHEHHHLSGRTVPYEAMRRDLLLMKRSNINAIRAAHQPHHPALYDVADELGFYVVGEADLECHGFGNFDDAESWTSDNPAWREAYLDRAYQLVARYRNHASIIFWSLGNECFYGSNHAAMADWIHAVDPTRIIHYEPDVDAQSTDMYSLMYPSLHDIAVHLKNYTDKPLVLCEFAHAMGNGPGGMKEYVELFHSEPNLQGGLVWEWNNHGILTEKDGIEYYAYGGDFGDTPNDADFLMDGLTLSDHTPMPSLTQVAKLFSPVQVKLSEDGEKMVILNHYAFSNLDELEAFWYLVQDDGDDNPVAKAKPLSNLPDVPAGENRTMALPVAANDLTQDEGWVTVEFRLREANPWAEKGHVVAWDQLHLENPSSVASKKRHHNIQPLMANSLLANRQQGDTSDSPFNVSQPSPSTLQVTSSSSSSTFTFNLVTGDLDWSIGSSNSSSSSSSIFAQSPHLAFYRAMTENDLGDAGDGAAWTEAHVDMLTTQIRDVNWGLSSSSGSGSGDSDFQITYSVLIAPKVLSWGVECTLTFTIPGSSSSSEQEQQIKIAAAGAFTTSDPTLPHTIPRIGLEFQLPSSSFDQVSWFGKGPGENYRDSSEGWAVGRYQVDSVQDLFTKYDFPQENGNRGEVRWVGFSGEGKRKLKASMMTTTATDGGSENNKKEMMKKPFSFTAKNYFARDLDQAGHPYELPDKRDVAVVNVDYENHGLGTATCGFPPWPQYECRTEKGFEFEVLLGVE